MHHEASETARLANLLGRALQAAIALPVMTVLAVSLAGGAGAAPTTAWAILITVASLSVARTYAHAIGQPFERAVLKAFALDLQACCLYAGFAWGAGAFLALPGSATAMDALLFAGVPAAALAALLRDPRSDASVSCAGCRADGIRLRAAALRPWRAGRRPCADRLHSGRGGGNCCVASCCGAARTGAAARRCRALNYRKQRVFGKDRAG